MRVSSSVLAVASLLSTANAAIKGFNYGAYFNNNQAKTLVDFEYEFNAAKTLPGTDGWTSARIYTMIQHGTQNTPIEAIQAAINTNTTLLLGLWASAGQGIIDNELAALKAAIQQYGTPFTDLVVGISVGSEDLYRVTPTGIENNSGAGAQPSELVNYIQQTRSTISGTGLQGKPIGHVDTWTVYVNASNNAVIEAVDFIGMDAYPYFQSTMTNGIGSASQLFFDAYHATVGAAEGKPVWITETGWPVSGKTLNQAEPNTGNARIYWEDVTCQLVKDNVNLYYYTLQDVQYGNPSPSFGIKPAGDLQFVQPLFDLSCPASTKPEGWAARANGGAKTSTSLSHSGRGVGSMTNTVFTQLSSMLPTIDPTMFSLPMIIPDRPSSSPPVPSASTSSNEDHTGPTFPRGLKGDFEAPHLIVAIDRADASKLIGNSHVAQLSPTVSTLVVYDINPSRAGKTCTLTFHMPLPFDYPELSPVKIRSPGGINVSRVKNQVSGQFRASVVSDSSPVGSVPALEPGHEYSIVSGPCEAGQRVVYQIDSTGGLEMEWFQLANPPLGPFLMVN